MDLLWSGEDEKFGTENEREKPKVKACARNRCGSGNHSPNDPINFQLVQSQHAH